MTRRRLWRSALLLALSLVLVPTALASTITGGQEYVLKAGETTEGNLYAFGQTVRIDGRVKGDLISSGSNILVGPGGVVEGDVLAAGQSVVVSGDVQGDIRAAGFMIQVEPSGKVGGEVVAAGYSIGVGAGATVGDDLMAAGAQGLIDGSIGGDVRFAGAALDIQGQVTGDVDAEVDAPGAAAPQMWWTMFMQDVPQLPRNAAMGLTVGDSARIGGKLNYTSPAPSTVADSAAGGGVVHTTRAVQETAGESDEEAAAEAAAAAAPTNRAWDWFTGLAKQFFSLAIIGLLLAWLTPRLLGNAHGVLAAQPAPSAGWGCLTMILAAVGVLMIGVAMILGLIVVGGVDLDPLVGPVLSASFLGFALLTAGTVLLGWIGRVVVSLWLGRWLLARLAPAQAENRYVTIVVGALVFAVLASLPYVGGILSLAGVALGLGALVMYAWPIVNGYFRPAPEPAAAGF